MKVRIHYVNRTEHCRNGEEEIECNTFREIQKEFGKCISKMYVDMKNGETKQIGWVFLKKQKYSDCNDKFLQETWIERISA